jgi:ubiquinone/menaquinone biosynthesis C-methylase UbiE
MRRLVALGAQEWPREAAILSLFCGRGGELHALTRLGFTRIEGIDLSASLLAQYDGPAICHVADCRQLPYDSESKDIIIVQGGLHHLSRLPEDLEQVLREVRRVLKPDGCVLVIEPWLTPFLKCVHFLCDRTLVRALWSKVDALAVMIEHERSTYEQWLAQPRLIEATLDRHFVPVRRVASWGKLRIVARRRVRS